MCNGQYDRLQLNRTASRLQLPESAATLVLKHARAPTFCM